MLARAKSGMSAWSYLKDSCPITINKDGTVTVALDFYSWPSALDFPYAVTVSIGALSPPTRIEQEREADLIVTSGAVQLPWLLTMPSVEWTSHCFDDRWRVIARPQITMDGATLRAPGVGFGVARVRGMAQGYLHTTRITLRKQTTDQDEQGNINVTGFKIDNLRCDATASWRDQDGEQALDKISLEVPKCVESYLATCGDGENKSGTVIGGTEGERRPYVYYNSCTGSVLLILYL
jgi:hypothetical protein